MGARLDFFDRMALADALRREALLIDTGPGISDQTNKARMLRSGLFITVFNALEHFLKERFAEIIAMLGGTTIAFPDFDDELKKLVTVHAITGLSGHLMRTDAESKIDEFMKHANALTRFAETPPIFSGLGFGYDKSNLSVDDLSRTLTALGVASGWTKMGALSGRAGLARLSLKADFQSLKVKRNGAAHTPMASVTSSDLEAGINISRAIALGFDILASDATRILVASASFGPAKAAIAGMAPRLRFIDEGPAENWAERSEGGARAIRRFPSKPQAVAAVCLRAGVRRETVVVRNGSLVPVEWHG
jgi:hypothetical protein